MIYDKKRLGDYITLYDLKAKDSGECFVLNDIVGISSITKSFVPTKANLNGVTVDSYKVVPPGFIAYNPNTARMGDKVCIALNRGRSNLLVSSIYPVFHVDEARLVPDYLLLWFKRPEFDRWARFVSHGSAREVLDWSRLCEFEIPVPPLKVQRKIVHYYQTISNRIALLQKINENLEEQVFALFDIRFPETEKGDKTIGDYVIPKRGKNLLSKDAIQGQFPVVAGGLEPTTYHCVANTDSPVLTISASGANSGFVRLWNSPVWSSDSSYIDASMTSNVYFWYSVLKKRQREIYDAQTGSAQPHIYPTHIARMPIIELAEYIVSEYTELVSPLFNIIGANDKENIYLSNLRDTLLPKLMSGEIDVSDLDI